nr:MAG TPA: hypothetical protein [Caudoviricetes sp.]
MCQRWTKTPFSGIAATEDETRDKPPLSVRVRTARAR